MLSTSLLCNNSKNLLHFQVLHLKTRRQCLLYCHYDAKLRYTHLFNSSWAIRSLSMMASRRKTHYPSIRTKQAPRVLWLQLEIDRYLQAKPVVYCLFCYKNWCGRAHELSVPVDRRWLLPGFCRLLLIFSRIRRKRSKLSHSLLPWSISRPIKSTALGARSARGKCR